MEKSTGFKNEVQKQVFSNEGSRHCEPKVKQSSGVSILFCFSSLMDTAPPRVIVLCSGLLRLRSQ
ncbi:MAG: hypothetical protein RR280_07650 [Bacteroidaceae bacterium]